MKTEKYIHEIFKRLSKTIKNPTTELEYTNDFTLLVAVVLSAQTTDKNVNKATKELFKIADTPQKMVKLGEDKLKKYIKSIGLFNSKAHNIIKLSNDLINKFNSTVPSDRKELESLSGVGRKTANVILNTIFDKEVIAVDTHIFRLSNRLEIAPGKNPIEVEKKLMQVVPKEFLKDAHHLLILHGRYVCKAKKPNCKRCILNDICKFIINNHEPTN